ncbi:MAG: M15 family metallopeptidase [Fidelibacterota bacterium]
MTKQFSLFLVIIIFVAANFAGDLPDGFVILDDYVDEYKLDLRYITDHNFLGTPVDGYESEKCIITEPAAQALQKLSDELSQYGFGIKVFDTYRPQRAVDHFVRWAKDLGDTLTKSEFYPTVKKENLFEKGYIAAKSSHSRGSTVDLTIYSLKTGEELDMGSHFDYFGRLSWVITPEDITPEQQAHRMLLQTLMAKYGFNNYAEEWWHFTLKNEPYPDTYFDFPVQ